MTTNSCEYRQLLRLVLLLVVCAGNVALATAGVLPEDRADILYHLYDGGGATIDGPAVLVRKGFGDKLSISGKYYVDTVSSASIDVITTASAYKEERKESSFGLSYLYGSTIFNLAYTKSDENDFDAASTFFNISQEMFGALTTVTLGYGLGNDTVMRNDDDTFSQEVDRQHYQLGLSQIISKNWLMTANLETITDEGYLNNPYRQVRYADSSVPRGFSYEQEVYPRTRTSSALALRSRYYLKHGAAITTDYRYFTDTWDIEAHTVELGYIHKFSKDWLMEVSYRYYTQTAADFYSDLYDRPQSQNFLARDKELSSFSDQSIRIGASYQIGGKWFKFIERGTINVFYNHIAFNYDNFRNLAVVPANGNVPGSEPLYEFGADVAQIYLSVWY